MMEYNPQRSIFFHSFETKTQKKPPIKKFRLFLSSKVLNIDIVVLTLDDVHILFITVL